MGINDIVFGADPEENIQRLLEAHANLYDAGMRNFLFFNLPPLHKYPSTLMLAETPADPRSRVRRQR